MDLFAIDDSKQNKPTRDGMGPLVAVGGVHVAGDTVRDLEVALDALCKETGFPDGEEFKWSPDKKSWEYENLKFGPRDEFNLAALKIARDAGATGIVVMEDITKRPADATAPSHEVDVYPNVPGARSEPSSAEDPRIRNRGSARRRPQGRD